jgi:hypothetical protein
MIWATAEEAVAPMFLSFVGSSSGHQPKLAGDLHRRAVLGLKLLIEVGNLQQTACSANQFLRYRSRRWRIGCFAAN